MEDDFYEKLPRIGSFDSLVSDEHYADLPKSWIVGVADVVDSTGHLAAGRYKTVNMAGAAVISAVMNANKGFSFPFVFGGDGAGFAIPPSRQAATSKALSAVAGWAAREFNLEMRVALVPMEDVLAQGAKVRVARFQASEGADYAMFSGGGLTWAEREMKAGRYASPAASAEEIPDLDGLSCRWSHMPAQQGKILSLVIQPDPEATASDIAELYGEVIRITGRLQRAGHPAPETGMAAKWPPKGAQLEAHAARGTGSLRAARNKALFEAFVAWVLIRTGLKIGGFDARRYSKVVAANADFRKLDDGLKMTIDCDDETHEKLDAVLSRAQQDGIVTYGISSQDEAMMTCIVPSIMTDDHFHFIDGAAGGYTQAAASIKARLG